VRLSTRNTADAPSARPKPRRETLSELSAKVSMTSTTAVAASAVSTRVIPSERLSRVSTDCASRAIENMMNSGSASSRSEWPPAVIHSWARTSEPIEKPPITAKLSSASDST
jgi:hypothetical protein